MFLFLGENTQEVGKQFHVCLVFAAGSVVVVVVCMCALQEKCVLQQQIRVSQSNGIMQSLWKVCQNVEEKRKKSFLLFEIVQIRNIQAERCISHLLGKYRQFFANYTSCCCVFDLEISLFDVKLLKYFMHNNS